MKSIITTILLTASLLINALFIYDRLDKQVYQEGIKDGNDRLAKKITEEIVKNKRLIVKLPNGKNVVMVPQAVNPPAYDEPNKIESKK